MDHVLLDRSSSLTKKPLSSTQIHLLIRQNALTLFVVISTFAKLVVLSFAFPTIKKKQNLFSMPTEDAFIMPMGLKTQDLKTICLHPENGTGTVFFF